MHVYVVTLYSSGERWHTMVCWTSEIAQRILKQSYGMTREYGHHSSEFQDYRNLADISQAATVQLVKILEQ